MVKTPKQLAWTMTPWIPDGEEGWKEQPVILVETRRPFFADHPTAYIEKLEDIHNDHLVADGSFWKCIGELKDCLDYTWDKAHPQRKPGVVVPANRQRNGRQPNKVEAN